MVQWASVSLGPGCHLLCPAHPHQQHDDSNSRVASTMAATMAAVATSAEAGTTVVTSSPLLFAPLLLQLVAQDSGQRRP